MILEFPQVAVDPRSQITDDNTRRRHSENPTVGNELVAPLIEKQHVGQGEDVLVTFGDDISNPKQSRERESRNHAGDRPKSEADGEKRRGIPDRFDSLKGDSEKHRGENRANRIDQDTLRLEHGRHPRTQSQISHQRPHHGWPRDDHQPAEDE